MLDLLLRDIKEKTLAPIARALSFLPPDLLSFMGFVMGIACCAALVIDRPWLALLFWSLNRLADGLDGIIARMNKRTTAFGAYIDIFYDFTVYSLIPISIAYHQQRSDLWLVVSLLEAIYFVNAAMLFMASALLERWNQGAKSRKEKTSVSMPPALVEGFETMMVYFVVVTFPAYAYHIFILFAIAVATTTLQRLNWARANLHDP